MKSTHSPEPKQLSLIPKIARSKGKKRGRKKRLPPDIRSHLSREMIDGSRPLHVTIRLRENLPSLRHKQLFKCFKTAVAHARTRGLRICHFSIMHNHGHFIVEVKNRKQLESLMKILTIRLALAIRKLTSILGGMSVFRDRYHLHVLKTLRETRNALKYVLLNEDKHRRGHLRKIKTILVSPFSSAVFFNSWDKLLGPPLARISSNVGLTVTSDLVELQHQLAEPRTWHLKHGWIRALLG